MVTAEVLGSPVVTSLLQLEAAGLRFRLDGDQLLVSPPGVLTHEQRDLLQQHKTVVRALVPILSDTGVQDRRKTFARQLETPSGVLVARLVFREAPYVNGYCHACGDALERLRWGSCWRCSLARRLASRAPVPADLFAVFDEARTCT